MWFLARLCIADWVDLLVTRSRKHRALGRKRRNQLYPSSFHRVTREGFSGGHRGVCFYEHSQVRYPGKPRVGAELLQDLFWCSWWLIYPCCEKKHWSRISSPAVLFEWVVLWETCRPQGSSHPICVTLTRKWYKSNVGDWQKETPWQRDVNPVVPVFSDSQRTKFSPTCVESVSYFQS